METYSRTACAQNIGAFAGAQEAKTTFHTVHIARYDFLLRGQNSARAKKNVCARMRVGKWRAARHMDGG